MAYQYATLGLTSNLPTEQIVGSDSFTFAVLDSHLNSSTAATINVTVSPGVWALASTSMWQCYEDTLNEVFLYGNAAVDSKGNISFTISALPTHGDLFDGETDRPIALGSTLSTTDAYPYRSGVRVIYRPAQDFFTAPNVTWNGSQVPLLSPMDTISFYTSTTVGSATMASSWGTQQLRVVNVNDNSTISCPVSVYDVQAIGNVEDDTIDRPDQVFIYNFSIADKDRGVDAIRVDIAVEYGVVSLNETYTARLNFMADCDSNRNVVCRGDGDEEKRMIFVGQPEDVQLALNGMKYQTHVPYTLDSVNITLYDGSEGACLEDFTSISVRPSCALSTCVVLMNASSYYIDSGDDDDDEGQIKVNINILVAVLLVFGAIFGLACRLGAKAVWIICCSVCGKKRVVHPVSVKYGQNSSTVAIGEDVQPTSKFGPNAQRPVLHEHATQGEYEPRSDRYLVDVARDFRNGSTTNTFLSPISPRVGSQKPSWGDE